MASPSRLRTPRATKHAVIMKQSVASSPSFKLSVGWHMLSLPSSSLCFGRSSNWWLLMSISDDWILWWLAQGSSAGLATPCGSHQAIWDVVIHIGLVRLPVKLLLGVLDAD
jgi:hypothetical protein